MKLDSLEAATCPKDLTNPPGNRIHPLTEEYEGYYALAVNGPWRLIFRFEEADVHDVQLIQYH